ncbi:MAG: hypothetical protein GX158_04080 [Bacteroidales bacterium]|jgi:DNA uptake protein ComE-like DNA-binding protein|nr:hypothetical protein [Bacteroidales bacterium]
MARFSLEAFKDWFGYTRRERRSTFILLLFIVSMAGIRFMVPGVRMKLELTALEEDLAADSSIRVFVQDNKVRQYGPARSVTVIDLNKCDSTALMVLPGIGPVLSARIIKYRNLLGGYAEVSQLREVYGLPEETYNRISARLKADREDVRKIMVNRADYRELLRFPYFERYDVSAILKYRELQGKIESCGELVENKILSSEKADRVKWYLDFSD